MNPLISKQTNVNSPQYYLRNDKKNMRSISPTYSQTKNKNQAFPVTLQTENSTIDSSALINQQKQIEQKKKETQHNQIQETPQNTIEKVKAKTSIHSSKVQKNQNVKSPIKSINQSTYIKISKDLPKSAQKILTEIATRSRSNNTSQHSNQFSKSFTQSFKPSINQQIIQQHNHQNKQTATNSHASESNISEEVNQAQQDETLESFYREIEKNKQYLSNQRACSSVSPIAIDKKLLSQLEKNNRRVQQVYSQIQNQMKYKGTSPNQNNKGKSNNSPLKSEYRKFLYQSYSQEKIQKILHGEELQQNIEFDTNYEQNYSRKQSPLFGNGSEQNEVNNHYLSQNISSPMQQRNYHIETNDDNNKNEQKSNGQAFNIAGSCKSSKTTSQSSFNFIGKYKQIADTKNKTQITSLTKFMKKMNNDQYQGSSYLYQQLQKSQKLAQDQMRNILISPSRKNTFFGQSSVKESFVTPARLNLSQKDYSPNKQVQNELISLSNSACIAKGSLQNSESIKNQIEKANQNQLDNTKPSNQDVQPQKSLQEKAKGNGNSKLVIISNNKKQQQLNKINPREITAPNITSSIRSKQQSQERKVGQENHVKQQIEKLNEQNKIKDQQINQLNNQVKYLIEQITKQSQLTNEDEQFSMSNNTLSFDQHQQEKYESSSMHHNNQTSNLAQRQMGHNPYLDEYTQYQNGNSFQNGNYPEQYCQEASFRQQQQQNTFEQKQQYQSPQYNNNYNNPTQSPSSNYTNGQVKCHQKQMSFSAQEQNNFNQEDHYNSEYHTDGGVGHNYQIEYSYENQEIQSEPLNENSIQQFEKRCKTEEEDFLDNNNQQGNIHYQCIEQDMIPLNNILTPRSIDLNQQVSQNVKECPQNQIIQPSYNQNKSEDKQNIDDIKIINNFQASLYESIKIQGNSNQSSSPTAIHSQINYSIKLVTKQSNPINSGRDDQQQQQQQQIQREEGEEEECQDSNREQYKTPFERSMQEPLSQQVEYEKSAQDQLSE